MILRKFRHYGATLFAAISFSGTALAQTSAYPSKPIRLVIPLAPGGGTDILARVIAAKMTEMTGQSVVVDNRSGAGGTIGSEIVVRAAPDGYTLSMSTVSYAVNASFYQLPYDPVKDISPIALIGTNPSIMVAHPSVPLNSIKELVAHAKANPGKLTYGSTGQGAFSHLVMELFGLMAHINLTHVPYRGTGPVLTDLLAGQIQLTAGSIVPTIPHVRSGKLRALAVTAGSRSRLLPNVPTVAEAGVPGYEVVGWYGMFGPPRLPPAIVKQLNTMMKHILDIQDVRNRFEQEGADVAHSTPEKFLDIIKTDIAKYAKVTKVIKN